jgi:hypothetical protein
MGMALARDDLLPGEELLLSKPTNAVIRPSEYGLERFPFDKYLPLVGMDGREAIGGKLHLTNYRLLFKAHGMNRVKGEFSVFLPTIRDTADASHRVTRKVRIETPSQQYEFVIWGITKFLAALTERRSRLGETEREELLAAIQAHPEVVSDDLEVNRSVDLLIRRSATTLQALKTAPGRGVASTLVNLADLLGS